MARKSKITKTDIKVLVKKLHQAEEALVTYGLSGCQEKGIDDDMMACVELMDLRKTINQVLGEENEIQRR